jgi:hypothetical protein
VNGFTCVCEGEYSGATCTCETKTYTKAAQQLTYGASANYECPGTAYEDLCLHEYSWTLNLNSHRNEASLIQIHDKFDPGYDDSHFVKGITVSASGGAQICISPPLLVELQMLPPLWAIHSWPKSTVSQSGNSSTRNRTRCRGLKM